MAWLASLLKETADVGEGKGWLEEGGFARREGAKRSEKAYPPPAVSLTSMMATPRRRSDGEDAESWR